MPIFAPSFAKWKLNEEHWGKAIDATPGHHETVYLQEGSLKTTSLPWVFKAYRKVVQVNNMTVTKIMLIAHNFSWY